LGLLLALCGLTAASGSSLAQSFNNPSFETDAWPVGFVSDCVAPPITVSQWTYNKNGGYGGHVHNGSPNYGPTPFGDQFILLDGGTTAANPSCRLGDAYVEQTVSGFVVGLPYQLSFSISSEASGFPSQAISRIAVTLTGATKTGPVVFSAAGRGPGLWDTWVNRTLNFTPTTTAVTFHFEHIDPIPLIDYNGVGLDNLAINPGCACLGITADFEDDPASGSDITGVPAHQNWLLSKGFDITGAPAGLVWSTLITGSIGATGIVIGFAEPNYSEADQGLSTGETLTIDFMAGSPAVGLQRAVAVELTVVPTPLNNNVLSTVTMDAFDLNNVPIPGASSTITFTGVTNGTLTPATITVSSPSIAIARVRLTTSTHGAGGVWIESVCHDGGPLGIPGFGIIGMVGLAAALLGIGSYVVRRRRPMPS